MRIKKSVYLSLLLVVMSSSLAHGQDQPYVIRGTVFDQQEGTPLPFASVFLANTTFGVATDDEGKFELEVPVGGTYLLLVRFVGYEVFKVELELGQEKEVEFNIKLLADVSFVGEHVVTGRRPPAYYEVDGKKIATRGALWKVYYKHFEKYFLGTSNHGLASRIDNPEVIEFIIDEQDSSFTAKADDALEVINNALGYKLTYLLEKFEVSFSKETVEYFGYPLFEELEPKNEKQLLRWKRNRWRAYRGSLRHFLEASYRGQTTNAGFEAKVLDLRKFSRELENEEATNRDHNFYSAFSPSNLPASKKYAGAKTMVFPGVLLITDGNNIEDSSYEQPPQQTMLFGWKARPQERYLQRSWIQLREGAKIEMASNGYVYNPLDFDVYGYWAFERVGELLPFFFDQTNMNDQ